METDRLNEREAKTNGENQHAVLEMVDINHVGTHKSTTGENKRSG